MVGASARRRFASTTAGLAKEHEAAAFSDDDRKLMRLDKVRPINEELLSWRRQMRPHEPPQTPLAKACGYVLNHHVALMRFLNDGSIPIDNSLVERLHRRPAIARRNSLFVGSHAGGECAAIAFSTLATCRLIRLNPVDYLADVLPTLARGVELDQVPALSAHAQGLEAGTSQRRNATAGLIHGAQSRHARWTPPPGGPSGECVLTARH